MAYYIDKLANGFPLPLTGKADFLLKHVPGAFELGVVCDGVVRFEIAEIVCVCEFYTHDAACYIDIQRQFDICAAPTDPETKRWLYVPGARELSGCIVHKKQKIKSYSMFWIVCVFVCWLFSCGSIVYAFYTDGRVTEPGISWSFFLFLLSSVALFFMNKFS
jgi:hypothetical protein